MAMPLDRSYRAETITDRALGPQAHWACWATPVANWQTLLK